MEHHHTHPPFRAEILNDGSVRVGRCGHNDLRANGIPATFRFAPASVDPLLVRLHRCAAACEAWRGRARPHFDARLFLRGERPNQDLGYLVINASVNGISLHVTTLKGQNTVGSLWASHQELPALLGLIAQASGISAHQAMEIARRGHIQGADQARIRMSDLSPRQLRKTPLPLRCAA